MYDVEEVLYEGFWGKRVQLVCLAVSVAESTVNDGSTRTQSRPLFPFLGFSFPYRVL